MGTSKYCDLCEEENLLQELEVCNECKGRHKIIQGFKVSNFFTEKVFLVLSMIFHIVWGALLMNHFSGDIIDGNLIAFIGLISFVCLVITSIVFKNRIKINKKQEKWIEGERWVDEN